LAITGGILGQPSEHKATCGADACAFPTLVMDAVTDQAAR
jgi:hypothetical protein